MARQPKGAFYVLTSFDQRALKVMKRLDPTADILFITSKIMEWKNRKR